MLLVATVLVVAGIVVLLTRGFLRDALDDQLSATTASFTDNVATEIEAPEELPLETRLWLRRSAFPAGMVVAVRTTDGQVLSSAGSLDLEEVTDAGSLLEATDSRWWKTETGDGTPVRALSVPVFLQDQRIGTIVAAASRAGLDETLAALLSGIAWAAGIGLLLSALIGLAVIRRTLRPLERMAADIKAVQETGDLARRVSAEGPMDEVGRMAEAFNKMLVRLHETFESHRRFLSDASHELRTPLTVARGQLELVAGNGDTGFDDRSLAVALEELDRMGRIVEELLLLARLDEGMSLSRGPVEVDLVIREALLRGMLIERRRATVDVPEGLFVLADEERLFQVLTNLVTNAVQHTDSDAAIAVTARPEGSNVVIEVADSGPGIPAEDLPHVFERLYRGSHSDSGQSMGAGLGLAIAASLVEVMGGSINVSSDPTGTTFRICLPLADAPESTPVLGIPQVRV
jgi:two-component system OmpR family sensor kinase